MSVPLISYMTAAIAAHALLLSLGGLMVVNSLRALAQVQQEGWEAYLDAQRRLAPIVDVPARNREIEHIKITMVGMMMMNMIIGSFGILYSLVVIAFLSESSQAYVVVGVSFAGVLAQLIIFVFIAGSAMRFVGLWVQKAP